MRKLILLAAAIALVALVLILVNALGTRAPVATLPSETAPHQTVRAPAQLDADSGAESDRLARESAGTTPGRSASNGSGGPSLRIRISFVNQPDHEPDGLEVRISDLLGAQRDAHAESPLEFVVPGLVPGEYVVAAGEKSAIGAVEHAKVTAAARETSVDIALEPMVKLRVHWKSAEGTPIVSVERAHAELPQSLVVYASRTPLDQYGPLPDSVALAVLDQRADVESSVSESRFGVQRTHARRATPLGEAEDSAENSMDDLFGVLNVPAEPPFFVSAWSCGALVETQSVARGQSDVAFTTSLEQLEPQRVPVRLCIVDEETGEPRADARVSTSPRLNEVFTSEEETPPGCHAFDAEPGRLTLFVDESKETGPDPSLPHFVSIARELRVMKGQPVDVGRIPVSRARKTSYRVLDEAGKLVERAEFELVELSSYDGSAQLGYLRHMWSDQAGVLTFDELATNRYAVICSSPRIDATPFVIDGSRIAVGDERITGDIVVRPVRQLSLVFDEPPRVGTLLMIETPDGLPVRTLEMDEFGVVPVWLGGTDYRVHLVEDGAPTVSVPFSIASDPCILHIKR